MRSTAPPLFLHPPRRRFRTHLIAFASAPSLLPTHCIVVFAPAPSQPRLLSRPPLRNRRHAMRIRTRLALHDGNTNMEPPLLRPAQRQRDADAPTVFTPAPRRRERSRTMRVLPCLCPVSACRPNVLVCTRPHGASERDPTAPPLVLHPPAALVRACTTATFARCKHLCARPHARHAKARPPNDANECERAAAADFAPPLRWFAPVPPR
ncbi:hypothetical protein B0H13DRAFT_2060558 [Mycena leptocephala]|nr:hypothetical protein B0H13DRAFT_2060558 [Mycena leptocephala]